MAHRVYLEAGRTWVFAVSLDWPGWARRGRDPERAIEELLAYAPRFGAIVGADLDQQDVTVVGTVPGNSYTDFGAPRVMGPWDERPSSRATRAAHLRVLRQCWSYFDEVCERAPVELAKGPRGGGRDRDQIVSHVREAERHFAPKISVRLPPRTPWAEQRDAIVASLRTHDGSSPWPADFALRIIAWHVVDHAWEIEDKTPLGR